MIKDYLLTPFQQFVKLESFSGILLFSATVLAMIWANSPYAESCQALWATKIGFGTEAFGLNKALILWINDGILVGSLISGIIGAAVLKISGNKAAALRATK